MKCDFIFSFDENVTLAFRIDSSIRFKTLPLQAKAAA